MSNEFVQTYVIEPQDPSVLSRTLSYDHVLELCGGPLEIIGLRAATDDSHTLELCVGGDPTIYHPAHVFELDGQRYVGTAVVMARNAAGELVDIDVSVKWVTDRVRFPNG